MTDLDTSAYTPAHEVENTDENEETERTRFQIPLDNYKEERLIEHLEGVDKVLRNGTEMKRKIREIQELLEEYDSRRFLKMHRYKCDRCGEIFDKKQGIGVHHKMNADCNGEDASYTKIRVDNNNGENT